MRVTCRLPGCPNYPPYATRHLCREHHRQYGGTCKADRPAWVTMLINAHQAEQRYQRERAPHLVSLDAALATGKLNAEELVPFRRASSRRPRRKKGTGVTQHVFHG